MGLLCGQKTRPTGFAEPTQSELDEFERQNAANDVAESPEKHDENEFDKLDENEDLGKDTHVRGQAKYYKDGRP